MTFFNQNEIFLIQLLFFETKYHFWVKRTVFWSKWHFRIKLRFFGSKMTFSDPSGIFSAHDVNFRIKNTFFGSKFYCNVRISPSGYFFEHAPELKQSIFVNLFDFRFLIFSFFRRILAFKA